MSERYPPRHEEIPVRVRAYVDKRVAPLVTALTAIDGLVTLESCEDVPVREGAHAVVWFGGPRGAFWDWRELAPLAAEVVARLRAAPAPVDFAVRLEWHSPQGWLLALLMVRPEDVAAAAKALRRPVAKEAG